MAAADRAGLAGDQRGAQRLDVLAARQALAFEQGEGDLERLLDGIALGAHLLAQRHQTVQLGLLNVVGIGQRAPAGLERQVLRPELPERFAFAFGLAPFVQLAMQLGKLFGQPDFAAALALQRVERLAGQILFGFGGLGLRRQRGKFALALLQACGQLHRLLQTRTVTAPGGAERLQFSTRFELPGQCRVLFGDALLAFDELSERRLAGTRVGLGPGAFFADRGQVGVQMAQAFFLAARLGEPRLGGLAGLFGRTQLVAGRVALALQFGETLLQALLLALQASQAVGGLAQQRIELLLAEEAMALRCELLEQLENAPGFAQALVLVFGVLQLLAGGSALALQALQLGEPLPLGFECLELLLQGFQVVELGLVLVFQRRALFRLQRL